MANRNFANKGNLFAMHVSPCWVNTSIVIGSTGAVTSFAGTLTSSVVRVSTGIYTINLMDPYFACMFASGAMQSPSSGLSGISSIEIQNSPSTSVANFPSPSLTIKCLGPSGAVADPASGSTITIASFMNLSSVKA